MDIQSFILGMGAVLVIALVIGSVIALVKVLKISKNFNEIQIWVSHEFENVKKDIEKRELGLYRRCDDIVKMIDSRSDKLYEKIMKESNPKNRILQMIGRAPKGTEPEEDNNE